MTNRFRSYRLFAIVVELVLAITTLGIAAHLASVFLPDVHNDFSIFSLVVPSLTILTWLLIVNWSQPRIEVGVLLIGAALWLAMGAWATDIVGHVQCDSLGGERTPASGGGTMSAKSYCYEMKVIQAFSWMSFVVYALSLIALVSLVNRAQRNGLHHAWRNATGELGWFGQYPDGVTHDQHHTHGCPPSMQSPQPYYQPPGFAGGPNDPIHIRPQRGFDTVVYPQANADPIIQHVPSSRG